MPGRTCGLWRSLQGIIAAGFDLATVLAHPEDAPKIEPLDTVRILGRYDLEPAPEVLITGEVNAPGKYRTSGVQHFRDAVYQAGGPTPEAWMDTAQLFRSMPDGAQTVFSITFRDALAGDALNNVLIEPRDHIVIHRQPESVSPPTVYVRGDVARPGRYPLAKNMRVSDLLRSAGGLLRSANTEGGDLTHYFLSGSVPGRTQVSGGEKVNLTAALQGEMAADPSLRDGDVLTVPQQGAWKDVGASVTIRGEVARPGEYGIRLGERLSSLLRRAGGLLPTASPEAAVFTRNSVYELQQKSRQELIQRIEQESTVVKTAINTTGTEEAALQQAAMQQRQRVLEALRNAPISGWLVIHLRSGQKLFEGSPDDVELRAGDSLEVPKQPGFVLVIGQVYNSNAITYTPGKNAAWYLSRSGGATGLANKTAIFIIRANGSVASGKGELWSHGALSKEVGAGDTIVVPEKVVGGGNTWKNLVAIAQIAQAGAPGRLLRSLKRTATLKSSKCQPPVTGCNSKWLAEESRVLHGKSSRVKFGSYLCLIGSSLSAGLGHARRATLILTFTVRYRDTAPPRGVCHAKVHPGPRGEPSAPYARNHTDDFCRSAGH